MLKTEIISVIRITSPGCATNGVLLRRLVLLGRRPNLTGVRSRLCVTPRPPNFFLRDICTFRFSPFGKLLCLCHSLRKRSMRGRCKNERLMNSIDHWIAPNRDCRDTFYAINSKQCDVKLLNSSRWINYWTHRAVKCFSNITSQLEFFKS